MKPEDKIYIAGHRGMVGSAICRCLKENGFTRQIVRSSQELDLRDQAASDGFFAAEKPDIAVICAAKVGGIHANNTYPAEFIYDNLMIAANAIQAAYRHGVRRLLFLGSTCIYPKFAEQPISEDSLLTGPLESTNEAYAIAKIAGLKLCQFYRKQYGVLFHSAMPTNLYGPGDNYHGENSHVIPALIRRFHEARETGQEAVTVWGSGTPLREFLHADDLAGAVLHLLQLADPPDWVNIGSGDEVSIGELAQKIKDTVGFAGKLGFDTSKPDGTPRKLTDSTRLKKTGWQPQIALEEGLRDTYQDFCANLPRV